MPKLRLAFLAVLVASCGGAPEPPPSAPPQPEKKESATEPAKEQAKTAEPEETKPKEEEPPAPVSKVAFVEVEGAPAPAKLPKIGVRAPTKNQAIPAARAADFEVKLDVKNWPAGEGDHLCATIDGAPCATIRDPKKPVKLKDVAADGGLAEGAHVLAIYPRRASHEAVKGTGKTAPVAVVPFYVGKKTAPKVKDGTPVLLFSTPTVDDKGILVDWVVANGDVADGKLVLHAMVAGPGLGSGKGEVISAYKPWRIENPEPGTYTIRLVLVRYEPGQMDSKSATTVTYVAKEQSGPLADVTRNVRVEKLGHHGFVIAQNPFTHWLLVSQQSAAVAHFSCTFEHVPFGGVFEHTSAPFAPFGSQYPLQH